MGLFGKEVFILAQIIVVEDDVYMREELIDVLEKAGYDAVPLLDFENAVSQIRWMRKKCPKCRKK